MHLVVKCAYSLSIFLLSWSLQFLPWSRISVAHLVLLSTDTPCSQAVMTSHQRCGKKNKNKTAALLSSQATFTRDSKLVIDDHRLSLSLFFSRFLSLRLEPFVCFLCFFNFFPASFNEVGWKPTHFDKTFSFRVVFYSFFFI